MSVNKTVVFSVFKKTKLWDLCSSFLMPDSLPDARTIYNCVYAKLIKQYKYTIPCTVLNMSLVCASMAGNLTLEVCCRPKLYYQPTVSQMI